MCEKNPGPRCAADTDGVCVNAREQYAATYPDGPSVDPLNAAQASFVSSERDAVHSLLASRDPAVIRDYTQGKWVTQDLAGRAMYDQLQAAQEDLLDGGGTLDEARAAGVRYAELAYAYKSHQMAERVRVKELDSLSTRAWMLESGHHAAIERVREMEASDPGLGRQRDIPDYLVELDKEVDDGYLVTHPWRDPRRSDVVAGLRALAAGPTEPAAAGPAREMLAVLQNPTRPARAEVEARRAGPGTDQWVAHEKARAAEAELRRILPPFSPEKS